MSYIETYINDRVDPQIIWHSRKATMNKTRFHLFQFIVIIAGSIVPLVNIIDYIPVSTRLVSAGLGSLVAIITSFIQLNKYDENWLTYRMTAELLKREKYMFLYSSGEYSSKDENEKNKLFVHKIETILMSETETQTKKEEKNQEK